MPEADESNSVLCNAIPPKHFVRFYESDTSLLKEITHYVGTGLEGGQAVVIKDKWNAALAVEWLRNDLGKVHSFSLFCAYPKRLFDPQTQKHEEVCAAHTYVLRSNSELPVTRHPLEHNG